MRLAKLVSGALQLFSKIVELRLNLFQKIRKFQADFLGVQRRLLRPLSMGVRVSILTRSGRLRIGSLMPRVPSVVFMRVLYRFLLGRLTGWCWRRRFREVSVGLEQVWLQHLAQCGWQILLRELVLPARTPFFDRPAQLLLERLRDGVKRPKGFSPLDYRYCCRGVGPDCTLDCRQRNKLCFGWLQRFQVELQQPRFVFSN